MPLYEVPVLSQSSPTLCWEACGRIMWQWRHDSLTAYTARAGKYATKKTGLTEPEMDAFYKRLGMRSFSRPKGANVRHALTFSPVVFSEMGQGRGHAMVTAGYNNGEYTVVNPCFRESISFDGEAGTCTAEKYPRVSTEVEGNLGLYIWYW